MKHRKHEHPRHDSVCTKSRTGTCHFGEEKCWFKHEGEKNDIEEISNENLEIITKIFDMMGKCTERFELIEDQLYICNKHTTNMQTYEFNETNKHYLMISDCCNKHDIS